MLCGAIKAWVIFLIAIYAEVIKKKERKKAQGYQYRKQRITVLQKTEFEEKNELLKERCEISFLQQSHLAQKSLLGLCQKRQKKNTAKWNMRSYLQWWSFVNKAAAESRFNCI